MKVIYKYPLFNSETRIRANNFKPLSIQLQNGMPTLWAEAEAESFQASEFSILQVGTGWAVPPRAEYVGTVLMPDGLVWHYYILN